MSLTDRQRTKEMKRFPKWKELLFPKHWTSEKILSYHYVIINGEEKIYP
jgi:hypothetical protein